MNNRKSLLVCMPDLPFPARKNGISIRYYPILEHAAKIFDIHLLVISSVNIRDEELAEAQRVCSKVSVYTRKKSKVSLSKKISSRLVSLLPRTTPFSQLHYDRNDIEQFILAETSQNTYDIALTVLATYQELITRHIRAIRYTLDLIDSPYSTSLRTTGYSLLKKYDSFLVKNWERRTINSADYACYISPLDRKLGAGEHINNDRIGIIPNGLYLTDFSNEKIDYGCKTIGYLGHMGYPPNIRAALRLYTIFKSCQQHLSNTKLLIIGRDPAPEIQQLSEDPQVIVTGTVDNIWTHINAADLFVFPMEIGSGQQNKLLEAMQSGIPVISTALGNSGIGATDGDEIVIANSDDDISKKMALLMSDDALRKNIGEKGKSFVQGRYAWKPILEQIDKTLLNPQNQGAH